MTVNELHSEAALLLRLGMDYERAHMPEAAADCRRRAAQYVADAEAIEAHRAAIVVAVNNLAMATV
jgi:hypothetical protein